GLEAIDEATAKTRGLAAKGGRPLVTERAERRHAHGAAGREESRHKRDDQREGECAEGQIGTDDKDRRWVGARVEVADNPLDHLTAAHAERESEDSAE